MDPFAAALDAIFFAPGSAAAVFTPLGGVALPDPIRIIRSQPTDDLPFGSTTVPVASNIVDIRRSEVADPKAGDALEIDAENFVIDGVPRLDVEGLTWSCELLQAG